jgi:hypothetical protein
MTVPAPALPRPGSALPLPSPGEVVTLQSVRGYPCVSVLVSTVPAPRMTRENAARLEGLVDTAVARLRGECAPALVASLADRLTGLAEDAVERPTRSAVALFATQESASSWSLPVTVVDRTVVDPSFATRDLVRSLHRTPRHVVLVLTDGEARLLDGSGDVLLPALGAAFPLHEDREPRRGRGRPRGRTVRAGRDTSGDEDAFLRAVDAALGAYLRLHPAPLVVAGTRRTAATFVRISRNTSRLAGVLHGSHARTSPALLSTLVRPVLENYLRSRQHEALELLDRRRGTGRTASGMQAVWLAARTERPEMLVVDSSFFYPARLSEDGDLVTPATDVDHPEVVDDLVDEVVEVVLQRGGWVALVDPGLLDAHDRIALTLRS